ncbi:MAG TPA: glycosyltransferase family 2 protein [Roseiflexaceae bacterium]|nr:glycosyltransferase family 2 protein [Roseiflexaceae bacterium]HMP39630.1 glycosyltransferase family 2 protein [Roseiflexaceae bacterium]
MIISEEETEAAVVGAPRHWPFSISVVIPAFNEGPRIAGVIDSIRAELPAAEIIVVDDASHDNTAEQAAVAGAHVIRRPHNIGNGAGVKTGVRAASGEVILVIDADGQHNPADIPRLLEHIDRYDMVVATRPDRTSHENLLRWAGNTLLNNFGTYLTGMPMRDLTSGFRAIRRDVMLEFLHLLPNQFGWPMTSAMALAKAGYHIRFEPVTMRKRQGGQSTQKLFKNGIRNILMILRMVSLFAPLRVYFPVALSMLGFSIVSFLISYFITDIGRFRVPNSAVGLFVGAIVVFMFGLLAEQIAALRLQRRDD